MSVAAGPRAAAAAWPWRRTVRAGQQELLHQLVVLLEPRGRRFQLGVVLAARLERRGCAGHTRCPARRARVCPRGPRAAAGGRHGGRGALDALGRHLAVHAAVDERSHQGNASPLVSQHRACIRQALEPSTYPGGRHCAAPAGRPSRLPGGGGGADVPVMNHPWVAPGATSCSRAATSLVSRSSPGGSAPQRSNADSRHVSRPPWRLP